MIWARALPRCYCFPLGLKLRYPQDMTISLGKHDDNYMENGWYGSTWPVKPQKIAQSVDDLLRFTVIFEPHMAVYNKNADSLVMFGVSEKSLYL